MNKSQNRIKFRHYPHYFRGSYLWEFLDLIHTNFQITTKLGKEPVVQFKISKFLTRRPWLSWHEMTPYWTSPKMLINAYSRNYRKNRKHRVRKLKFIAYVLYMCMYIWYKFYNFFQFPSWWAKASTTVNYHESRSFCLTLLTYSTHMIWIMLVLMALYFSKHSRYLKNIISDQLG